MWKHTDSPVKTVPRTAVSKDGNAYTHLESQLISLKKSNCTKDFVLPTPSTKFAQFIDFPLFGTLSTSYCHFSPWLVGVYGIYTFVGHIKAYIKYR